MPNNVKQEVKRVMATSLVPLNNDCHLHISMLRTVYRFPDFIAFSTLVYCNLAIIFDLLI